MPYTKEHKDQTRRRIIETARILFNRHGFSGVTIDQIMEETGLTRGGFYNHFRNKSELYALAVASFLNGRGKTWRDEAGVDPINGGLETVRAMIDSYLSTDHLGDIEGQCPMIAMPSDIGRSTDDVRAAFGKLLHAMVFLFEHNGPKGPQARQEALALSAMCVGGMVLARTVGDEGLADELRTAALCKAQDMVSQSVAERQG